MNMEINGSFVKAVITNYHFNNRKAIQLIDREDGLPYAIATVNVKEPLEDDEVVIKNYSENEGILELLEKHGYVKNTGKTIKLGYAVGNVCKLLKSE